MRTAVVLPIKRFSRAKLRLSAALAPGPRRALMAAMVADTLHALTQAGQRHDLLVVTREQDAAAAAVAAGARVVDDPSEEGHSPAALLGVTAAEAAGAARVLLLPGDCPLLTPADVTDLLAHPPAPGPRVGIVADRAGEGTNALLLEPPDVVLPAFGPGSFQRHLAAGRAAGARVDVLAVPSLELDVDTPDDLGQLRRALAVRPPTTARWTRAALAELGAVP